MGLEIIFFAGAFVLLVALIYGVLSSTIATAQPTVSRRKSRARDTARTKPEAG
jgi:hypothetical protein